MFHVINFWETGANSKFLSLLCTLCLCSKYNYIDCAGRMPVLRVIWLVLVLVLVLFRELVLFRVSRFQLGLGLELVLV